jgi:hypothetical protein
MPRPPGIGRIGLMPNPQGVIAPQPDDTEPSPADLDLSSDPELAAIPDPAKITRQAMTHDPLDPDTTGELDPDQTINLPHPDDAGGAF